MTQFSIYWPTNGIGDGSNLDGYTHAQTIDTFRHFRQSNVANAGVLPGSLNRLIASVVGAASVDVDTGAGFVFGLGYINTAVVNLPVTIPAVDTGGRIMLDATWGATQEVRLAAVLNTVVPVINPPALIQVPISQYQVPLFSFVIDAAGVIFTDSSKTTQGLTDERVFNVNPSASQILLRQRILAGDTAGPIVFSGIQQDLNNLQLIMAIKTKDGTAILDPILLQINGDTGANYSRAYMQVDGFGVVNSAVNLATTSVDLGEAFADFGVSDPNGRGHFVVDLPAYALAGRKAVMSACDVLGGAAGLWTVAGGYDDSVVSPITSIEISTSSGADFQAGCEFYLYGIK